MPSTDSYPHAGSLASSAKRSQSARCPRAQTIELIDDPPPTTLPIEKGIDRPLICGFGNPLKPQSRSLPKFVGHWLGSVTLVALSSPPASTNNTLTSGFSAKRRATTDPADPAPQTTKSYRGFSVAVAKQLLVVLVIICELLLKVSVTKALSIDEMAAR